MPITPKPSIYEQKRIRQREMDRQRKERSRHASKDALLESIKRETAMCADLERLAKYIKHDPERPGCWLWHGPWENAPYSALRQKPLMRVGQYGKMYADKAVWLASGNPEPKRGLYLRPRCGNFECVSPTCLYLTNTTQQRARKVLGLEPRASCR